MTDATDQRAEPASHTPQLQRPVRLDNHFHAALNDQAIIRVSGPDAVKFMQGQFTCDLTEVTSTQSRLGACCTPKGRMLALFRLVRVGEDFWIRLPRELAQPLLDHLKKFMVFFKTSMTLDEQLHAVGLVLPHAQESVDFLPDDQRDAALTEPELACIRVPGEPLRYELWGTTERLQQALSQLSAPKKDSAPWALADIAAGLGEVYTATREEFIPQMLNLQSLGGISFKKGCYTGQEIVARMQYLGTLKKRMYLASASSPLELTPGQPIQDQQGANLGTLVRSQAQAAEGTLMLAVLNQESLAEGAKPHLQLGDTIHALSWQEVPYPVGTISNERKKL